MAAHIGNGKKLEIVQMSRDGRSSLDIAFSLNLPHRTVKRWCERSSGDVCVPKNTAFHEIVLEAIRTLAWPTSRVLQVLDRFKFIVESHPHTAVEAKKEKISIFDPKYGERMRVSLLRRKALVKEMLRYMRPYGVVANVSRRWELGAFAVHSVQVTWNEHSQNENLVKPTKTGLKRVPGWLLILADRSTVNARNRQKWKLSVRFAILPGVEYDRSKATAIISEFVNNQDSGVRVLHLVTGEDGRPTATVEEDELGSLMPGVHVVTDKPSKGLGGNISIGLSYPDHHCLENYLGVVLAQPQLARDRRNKWWSDLGIYVAKDEFVSEQLRESHPFISR